MTLKQLKFHDFCTDSGSLKFEQFKGFLKSPSVLASGFTLDEFTEGDFKVMFNSVAGKDEQDPFWQYDGLTLNQVATEIFKVVDE